MSKRFRPPDEDTLGRTIPEPQAKASNLIHLPGSGRSNEHYYEPYTPLAGPVGTTSEPQETSSKKKAKTPRPIDAEVTKVNRLRKKRYDNFIDYMLEFDGDRVLALAATYELPADQIRERYAEYMEDVLLGITSSSVGNLLEKNGLGKASRVALLTKHAYSNDPKVSLVAVKLASDLEGDKHDKGTSFEEFIRRIKSKA